MYQRNPWIPVAMLMALLAPAALVGCGSDVQTGDAAAAPERGGQEEFGHYELPQPWPQPLPDAFPGEHDGWTWGSVGAVYAESPDRIWVAQRGERPLAEGAEPWTAGGSGTGVGRYHHVIFVVDHEGNLVEDWLHQDHLFDHPGGRGPHKIKMNPHDPEKHVWVIDDQLHQIFKFTYDGELVLTLGERSVPGRGPNNFARPTDIAWLPDGTFFISDGYDGTRVAKFDPEGNFLMDWGEPPADPSNPGPNEWNTVHSIAISQDRRIYVVDRAHRRMQVFDEDGNFLDMWSTGVRSLPYAHEMFFDQETGEEYIWVADGGTHRILKYDLDGNYLYGWGAPGSRLGEFNGPHSLTTDQLGNLYIAEVFNGRLQKFTPKAGADPAKLAGEQLRQYPVADD